MPFNEIKNLFGYIYIQYTMELEGYIKSKRTKQNKTIPTWNL